MFLIPSEVQKIADDIREMRIRGAGAIAIAAAEAMKLAALNYEGENGKFDEYMKGVARLLLKTRPTAVSLPNAVFYILNRLDYKASDFREKAVKVADEFISNVKNAQFKLAKFGSKLIKDDIVIMTHCHSTAVVNTLLTAWRDGKKFKVINTETRPKFQGRITATALAKEGIPVTHIPDSSIRYHMSNVDMVIVGADTVTSDGHLINKVGTSIVALAAKEADIEFFSASESIKFSPASLVGGQVLIEERGGEEIVGDGSDLLEAVNLKIRNPAFDFTPPELITGFITEYGILPPRATSLIIRYVFGLSSGAMQIKLLEEET
ncbi:MAG: ribose 1,5-bisphosphate isomerase [Fervidicoccus fontis]|jgi:ribose 1,5-bisphosphate isomerase|nr:MAG: ribose 1,5-bisphosphate isomerase [Fervidicoccus fontis]